MLQQETKALSAWTLFFHQAVADHLGLNPSDHKCLDLLLKEGPVTAGEIARRTGLTTGAVTGVIDRLERAGFVEREHDAEDRRRIIVRATVEKTECEVTPLFESLAQSFDKLCSQYSEEDLHLLIGFARKSQGILQEATRLIAARPPLPQSEASGDEVSAGKRRLGFGPG